MKYRCGQFTRAKMETDRGRKRADKLLPIFKEHCVWGSKKDYQAVEEGVGDFNFTVYFSPESL